MLCPDGTYVPPTTGPPAPIAPPSRFPIVPVAASVGGLLLLAALLR